MYLHQTFNSIQGDVYNAYLYSDLSFGVHFHKSFELIYVQKGETDLTFGEETKHLGEGDFALIPPYRFHGFAVPPNAEVWVAVFAESFVKEFAKMMGDREGREPVFTCPATVREYLFESLISHSVRLCGNDNRPKEEPGAYPDPLMRLKIKAALYGVCAAYAEQAEWVPAKTGNDCIIRLLDWIAKNFREDITLRQAASELGYQFQYLSQMFNSTVHIHFKVLINHYRYEYARQLLLEHPEKSVTEIAFESGFQSLRSFHRVYRSLSGEVPRNVRLKEGKT